MRGKQVTLTFSGVGNAAFAGVGLFANPDVACRCTAGYYLDVSSAPVSGHFRCYACESLCIELERLNIENGRDVMLIGVVVAHVMRPCM